MNRAQSIRLSCIPRFLVVGMVLGYQQVISPVKNALLGPGGCCRFYPSCSEYTKRSVMVHGVIKGLLYSLIRLSKCHPFHPGGLDPVKPLTSQFQSSTEPESLLDLPGQS